MSVWYISFAGEPGFLGATMVQADNAAAAIQVTIDKGINPGGEAAIWELNDAALDQPQAKVLLNRLASKAEMGDDAISIREREEQGLEKAPDAHAVVCENCNPARSHRE